MILVFIFVFIILLNIVLILSSVKVNVDSLVIDNEIYVKEIVKSEQKLNKGILKFVKELHIYIQLCFLNKIKIAQIEIDKDKLQKFPITKIKEKMNNVDIKEIQNSELEKQELKKALKGLKIELEKLNLEFNIGTEDVLLTTALVTIVSTAIGIILPHIVRKYKKGKYYYNITPIYTNQNKMKFNFKGIICIKVVHIIYVIYILLKMRRVKKNERTSNRGTYDYSYE